MTEILQHIFKSEIFFCNLIQILLDSKYDDIKYTDDTSLLTCFSLKVLVMVQKHLRYKFLLLYT
jgi:hypothetical protein